MKSQERWVEHGLAAHGISDANRVFQTNIIEREREREREIEEIVKTQRKQRNDKERERRERERHDV